MEDNELTTINFNNSKMTKNKDRICDLIHAVAIQFQ